MASRLCSFHLYSNIFCVAPPPSFTSEFCCDIMRGCFLHSLLFLAFLSPHSGSGSEANSCLKRYEVRILIVWEERGYRECKNIFNLPSLAALLQLFALIISISRSAIYSTLSRIIPLHTRIVELENFHLHSSLAELKATQFNWFSMNIGVDGIGGIEFKFAKI